MAIGIASKCKINATSGILPTNSNIDEELKKLASRGALRRGYGDGPLHGRGHSGDSKGDHRSLARSSGHGASL